MCRIIKVMNEAGVREIKNVCGVLTDYDISSWTGPLISDYTKTSQQRTGTPPFMARGLLDGSDTFNMYRHDVVSFLHHPNSGHTIRDRSSRAGEGRRGAGAGGAQKVALSALV